MEITPVAAPLSNVTPAASVQKKEQPQETFASVISKALNEVNDLQVNADKLTQQYITGETTDIAEVLLAAEKASLALQLTVQIRNKIVEAYQEISNMQM
jgi:flagellar hook-basal body complex protein FliE